MKTLRSSKMNGQGLITVQVFKKFFTFSALKYTAYSDVFESSVLCDWKSTSESFYMSLSVMFYWHVAWPCCFYNSFDCYYLDKNSIASTFFNVTLSSYSWLFGHILLFWKPSWKTFLWKPFLWTLLENFVEKTFLKIFVEISFLEKLHGKPYLKPSTHTADNSNC